MKSNVENRIDRAMAVALAIVGGLKFTGFQPGVIAEMAVAVAVEIERKVFDSVETERKDNEVKNGVRCE